MGTTNKYDDMSALDALKRAKEHFLVLPDCSVLSLAVLSLFVLFYQKIFAVTFDEDFARATGVRASLCNLLIAVVIAVIIVLAMNLVGSLLISALVIFPALSAMRVCRTFRGVVVTAAILSVVCTGVGILAAVLWPIPVGPSIVTVDILAFFVFFALGKLRKIS